MRALGRGPSYNRACMGEAPDGQSIEINIGGRRVVARGIVPVLVVAVFVLLLITSAAPAFVLYRAVDQIGREAQQGLIKMGAQHERLIDLQEAVTYTFMPPAIQQRMVLPRWVREQIQDKADLPVGQPERSP